MAFSHTRRIETWLRAADILLAFAGCVVGYYFPPQYESVLAYVMTAAWYAGLVAVGGQNASYLYPRYRILYSMALSLGFSAVIGILWMGGGHAWRMKGGVPTLILLAVAGTLIRLLISIILQRPAMQLIPCRVPAAYAPLLEEIATHPHVYVERPLHDPSDPLPAHRPHYPIFQVVTDLRLRERDYTALLPLYARVEIIDICELYESLFGKAAIIAMDGEWVLPSALRVPSPIHDVLSRLFDVLIIILTAPLTALLVGMGALAVKLTSRGPAFFVQERLGRYGRPFRLLKLRTMRTDAEVHGRQWSDKGDPRVTPVGRLLRATGIDELPQLLNILRGEMRLVGPRPECAEIAERLTATVPFYNARLLVAPGLSGWAQLHQGGDTTDADVLNKIRYDLYYLKHGTPLMDLRILLGTVQMLLHLAKPRPRRTKQPASAEIV